MCIYNQKDLVLITGGSGFVGTNLAERVIEQGKSVLILDNLGRSGVERNLDYLCRTYGSAVTFEIADIRDPHLVRDAVHRASAVFHLAGQVAVTTSITRPRRDFDVNMGGTLNVLETLRLMPSPPPLLFTSTNKVYGAMDGLDLRKMGERYVPGALHLRQGADERQPLDFHSPYGCSKGASDQYVLDYARTYNLPAVVFRMSCIYGPHQMGTEDQGWVAHFAMRALAALPLTLYGDGCQVRDILFVEDLTEAMLSAIAHIDETSGHAFNIGGGVENSTSLLELLSRIETLLQRPCRYSVEDWRIGDQKYYVSNTEKFRRKTGWQPTTNIDSGLEKLLSWLDAAAAALGSSIKQTERIRLTTSQGPASTSRIDYLVRARRALSKTEPLLPPTDRRHTPAACCVVVSHFVLGRILIAARRDDEE